MRRLTKGFTIVELLVVIVVIGILAAIVFISYGAVSNNAHDTAVKSDLQKIDDAFKQYTLDNSGLFPNTNIKLATLGLKLTTGSYTTTNKANIYVCTNATDTEYAVIAMSQSGKRFMVKSESGISEYTGSVVWNPTTANWPTTCADIDPSYIPASGNATGMVYTNWTAWTGAPSITNLVDNPSLKTNDTNWSVNSAWTGARVVNSGIAQYSVTRVNTSAAGVYIGKSVLPFTVVPSQTYTASVTVTSSVDATISIKIREGTSATDLSSTSYSLVAGVPQRISTTGAVTPSTTTVSLAVISNSGGAVIGDNYVIDDLMLTQGSTLYEYADGSNPGWFWQGTQYNSTSTGPAL
ncbi:MAG: prepilin-type N-terminal cleavage/methylation domain-containing protein [Candidatus Saccharimonadales bacterium]